MSIIGYFEESVAELRMPKTPDLLGIRFEGPVLTGEKSVQHRQSDEAIQAAKIGPANRMTSGTLRARPGSRGVKK